MQRQNNRIAILIFIVPLLIMVTNNAYAYNDSKPVISPYDILEKGYIQVIVESASGQSRLSAITAAKVIAQRDIIAIFKGLNINSTTTIEEGLTTNDKISRSVSGFLRGAFVVWKEYHKDEGYAELCMRLDIRGRGGAYEILMPLIQQDSRLKTDGPRFSNTNLTSDTNVKLKDESERKIQNQDMAAISNDGLIIDIGRKKFKPALIQRILTEKDEIIFDQSTVLSEVLAEKGCGGLTNDLGKAKALLNTWGSKEPMILKAQDVQNGSDIILSEDDAVAVFKNNRKNNFLEQAKVVFVVQNRE
jgi:hypothetical protein